MTVVEEIIARVNNSIISRADLHRSEEQLAAEAAKPDPGMPRKISRSRRTCCAT